MRVEQMYRSVTKKKTGKTTGTVRTCLLLLLGACFTGTGVAALAGEVMWFEDFELGWQEWSTDAGVLEIGVPTEGPDAAHSGQMVAGANLSGNYPADTDSRLISPVLALPPICGNETLQLRFWQWYSYAGYDQGRVQIRTWDGCVWGTWAPLGTPTAPNTNSDWSLVAMDVTAYADQIAQIAFYHTADHRGGSGLGWYVDDVVIWRGVPTWMNPETFNSGWQDKHTDAGVWDIGVPDTVPPSPISGHPCAATVLNGNYPADSDSRLVPPPVVLGTDPMLQLRFWQWYSYAGYDAGHVQISMWDGARWGVWKIVATTAGSDTNSGWSLVAVDLSEYAGQTVRIAFAHTADHGGGSSLGWYIDDIQIPTGDEVVVCDIPLHSDPGWEMQGQWEFGVPTGAGGEDHGNPDPAAAHTGQYVFGVNLGGDYTVAFGEPCTLTAGPFDLSDYRDVMVEYARCLNTDEPDYVRSLVEVSVDGRQNWSALWQHDHAGPITDSAWSLVRHSLGAVADGQPAVYLRWSYQILDARAFAYSGWNIDDIRLVGTRR